MKLSYIPQNCCQKKQQQKTPTKNKKGRAQKMFQIKREKRNIMTK